MNEQMWSNEEQEEHDADWLEEYKAMQKEWLQEKRDEKREEDEEESLANDPRNLEYWERLM